MASDTPPPPYSILVANLAPIVPEATLKELFAILGNVKSLELRAGMRGSECVVEFADIDAALTSLKLTGTDLGGKALLISAYTPHHNRLWGGGASPASVGLPAGVSPLLAQYDPAKAEEISRTIYVGNLDGKVTEEELRAVFSPCGEIAHIKLAGDHNQPTRFAFIEYASQASIPQALLLTGLNLYDRSLKVNQSKNAINKPTPRGVDSATIKKLAEQRSRASSRFDHSDAESERSDRSRRRRRSRDDRDRDRRRSRSRSRSRRRSPEDRRRGGDRDRERSRERRR